MSAEQDTAERKRWEEEREKIASMIAHEVRNRLSAIVTGVDILEMGIVNNPSVYRGIKEAVQKIQEVVTRFLIYARPGIPELINGDINLFLMEVTTNLESEKRFSRVKFEKDLTGESIKIPFDRDMMRQAMIDILLNSLDAMPDGGILKVRSAKQGAFIEVRVIDNGIGIPRDKLGQIFQPFYTTKKENIGLGLSIAENTVKAHRGKIEVKSEKQKGTRVCILLPLDKKKE